MPASSVAQETKLFSLKTLGALKTQEPDRLAVPWEAIKDWNRI